MTEPADKEGANSFVPIYEADSAGPGGRPPTDVAPFVQQIKETADKLELDGVNRGDVKLLSTALRELRYAFKVFSRYRDRRKVTVFGSARTPPEHPAYQQAVEFGRLAAEAGYMVITGAASGIMEAGHIGAGRENSIGVNIVLPFEQSSNPVITGDEKLMHMKYFFTRKLMFVKESDAIILFPGGFGTHDEGFEVLTLIQTGKSHLFPIVLVDQPGGTYWKQWNEFAGETLLNEGYISPSDRSLYRITDSAAEAVEEVRQFYRVFHSMRYIRGDLVLRIQHPLPDDFLAHLNGEFADIMCGSTFTQGEAFPEEANEPRLSHLTRLRFRFARHGHGRLRELIDTINRNG
jgi:uncharacterized protein (TIGR00730 family)